MADAAGHEALVARVRADVLGVRHGFGPMQAVASELRAALPAATAEQVALVLLGDAAHQVRMVGTLLLGELAAGSPAALATLRQRVAGDPSWQVREMLARAFDNFCRDRGYEAVLPVIADWLGDGEPAVRRAASEGLRIWTARDYFREHPAAAVALLSRLRADPAPVVRKSVGNALRDISRQHRALVAAELATWDQRDHATRETYRLAAKFIAPVPGEPDAAG